MINSFSYSKCQLPRVLQTTWVSKGTQCPGRQGSLPAPVSHVTRVGPLAFSIGSTLMSGASCVMDVQRHVKSRSLPRVKATGAEQRLGAFVLRFKPYYQHLLYKIKGGSKFLGLQMLMPSMLYVMLNGAFCEGAWYTVSAQ